MIRKLASLLFPAAFAASLFAQSPCFSTSLGTSLALGDDATAQGLALGFSFPFGGVNYTEICVCSNGYIWLGATSITGGDFSPSEFELRNGAPRICPLWCDFNPAAAGSGQVYFDNSTPGFAKISWAGVFPLGSTTPNDFQVVLDASGNVTVTYGVTTQANSAGARPIIIGASVGGGATTTTASLATLPTIIGSDSFAEEIPLAPNAAMPYANRKLLFAATRPGYVVSQVACVQNELPHPARAEAFGVGCPSARSSIYELFTPVANPADLSGRNLSFTPTNAQTFAVQPEVSPTSFADFANNLAIGDDQTVAIDLPFSFPYGASQISRIFVCSNGFLTLGGTNPGSPFQPNLNAFFNGSPRICGFWEDLNPPAAAPGGGVFADLDAVSGDFVVTWNQVPEYQNLAAETFQIALSPSGRFTIRWQQVQVSTGSFLAGFSRGQGAPLTPQTNLSEITSTQLSLQTVTPLTLAPAPASVPSVGTTFTQEVNGIQSFPNGVVAILFTSTEAAQPVPLDAAGLIGCTAYIQVPELFSTVQVTIGAPATVFSYSIPNDPFLIGAAFASQAISDDATANAFGFRVSNGVRWTLGL
jgi:hypothetical protein